MKKLIYVLAIAMAIVSCKKEQKDYVTLSGTISHKNSDSLVVRSRSYTKKINVNADGTFKDTLKVETGSYSLFDGKEQTSVYLKNGFDLQITLDTNEFDETITYSGVGAEVNNYLAQKALLQEQLLNDFSIYDLDSTAFDKKVDGIVADMKSLLNNLKDSDSTFMAQQSKQIAGINNYVIGNYKDKIYMATVLAKGKLSPKFTHYENYAGGTTSLDDLKGKYVYIDVWATWCGPCKAEIPFLKKVEKAYHNKNIEFVSISVDVAQNRDKWKQMIADKELGGIQLLADNNFKSQFVDDYAIRGIPRFILIDPQGHIVSANAPRPSSDKLIDLFNSLKI
ncbi:TlpA family protein disulfide reductase [Hwangdonia sp.]|uniref:TlpA family protein disulfide reductase n=1 Tax=Hwangdonia sp. TaxID=1883432 RepID=UPI003AB18D41